MLAASWSLNSAGLERGSCRHPSCSLLRPSKAIRKNSFCLMYRVAVASIILCLRLSYLLPPPCLIFWGQFSSPLSFSIRLAQPATALNLPVTGREFILALCDAANTARLQGHWCAEGDSKGHANPSRDLPAHHSCRHKGFCVQPCPLRRENNLRRNRPSQRHDVIFRSRTGWTQNEVRTERRRCRPVQTQQHPANKTGCYSASVRWTAVSSA